MSEEAQIFAFMRRRTRIRKQKYGVPCPQCKVVRPLAHPTIMLPGQRCKVDGYVDPRPRLTREQEDEVIHTAGGYRRSDGTIVVESNK